MKTSYFCFILIILFSALQPSYSIQTGSYDVTVDFQGSSRTISIYVPTTYDSTVKYNVMICLHGSGDNSGNYRNSLITSLKWQSLFKNIIFICPDGGNDYASDFYAPIGDEEFITTTIDYAKAKFLIDPTKIMLQGFSLGGRSALKYGLEHPDIFCGMLLNTPALQSVGDANNDSLLSLVYNYGNSAKFPIAITHGKLDPVFNNQLDTMMIHLSANKGHYIYLQIPNMKHAIPATAYTQKCINFLTDSSADTVNTELVPLSNSFRYYSSTYQPTFRLRNFGTYPLTSAEFSYYFNKTKYSYNWTGSVNRFDYADITLPELTCIDGKNTFSIKLDSANNIYINNVNYKLKDTAVFTSITKCYKLPYNCGFEDTDTTAVFWNVIPSGYFYSMMLDNEDTTSEGINCMAMINTVFFYDNQGTSEDLLSPILDLTSIDNPCLSFDHCFDYVLFTPPYVTSDYTYSDTLNILISNDYGKTYKLLYSKYGDSLKTTTDPVTNPTSFTASGFVPASLSDWRLEIIDLKDYKDYSHAIIKFQYVSGLGGSFYLDNIRFNSYQVFSSVNENNQDADIYIGPNPASDYIYIKSNDIINSNIQIFSLAGIKLYDSQYSDKIDII